MAIGEWNDNRNLFTFQKPALSADMDSLAENDHRILTQGEKIWDLTIRDGDNHLSSSSPDYYLRYEQTGGHVHVAMFTMTIWDKCPWDRLLLAHYIRTKCAAGGVLLWRGIAGAKVLIVNKTMADLTAGVWNEWAVIDITGLGQGEWTWTVEMTPTTPGGELHIEGAYAMLMSTVSGLVA